MATRECILGCMTSLLLLASTGACSDRSQSREEAIKNGALVPLNVNEVEVDEPAEDCTNGNCAEANSD